MNHNLYVLIMAGGEGTRFYPVSTPEKPKQFLSFWGERTFIQQTYDRIETLVPASNIYVATNQKYVGLVKNQLPNIPIKNIIGEPEKKNTAPCIAYVSKIIADKDKKAVVLVLPSDHVISREKEFRKIVERGIYIATVRDVLVTLGIKPTWPADCYGYIKLDKMIEDDPDGKWHAYTVDRFVEKPSVATAQEFIDDGGYVWNSGIFIWKAELILNEIKKYIPEMTKMLEKYSVNGGIKNFFKHVKSISIDYGVMEQSKRVVTVPCNIGWSDIGTWQSLYNLAKNEVIKLAPHIEDIMIEQLRSNGVVE